VKQVLTADKLAAALAAGSPSVRAMARPPRFNVGDRVRTRELNPATHIRLPRYVRGRQGTVHLAHGAHVLPDANAHGRGESRASHTIRFAATELWGPIRRLAVP
jgi:nitrile hydratase